MYHSIILFNKRFRSSSGLTPEFKTFIDTFKNEFNELVKPYIRDIEFSEGHFYISGFLTLKNGDIYYFNTGDVRLRFGMYIRTAESYSDFHGGKNINIKYPKSHQDTSEFQFAIFRALNIAV